MIPRINIFSSNLLALKTTIDLFKNEGYNVDTFSSVNEKTINSIYKEHPDIILLDIDINNSDGIEFCHQLKNENILNSFIVLYSHHKEDYIQIEAFKAGADDYIVKPISEEILLKKIAALLSRKKLNPKNNKPQIISYNNLKIDRESYLIFKDGCVFSLPRKQFEMLYLLIDSPQKVFSREEIFEKVWKDNNCLNSRIIDVHIRKIREKIGANIINTIKGVGYQLTNNLTA